MWFLRLDAKKLLIGCFLISILFHLIFVSLGVFSGSLRKQSVLPEMVVLPAIEVSLKPVIQSLQDESEAPKDADLASDKNFDTDTQTRTRDLAPSQTLPKSQRSKVIESFKLSEGEIMAMRDPLTQDSKGEDQSYFSPEFLKRLEVGDKLKVKALGLDYGQFTIRMKERLKSRWNPMNTFSPEMQTYNSIAVVLAVVLDRQGELLNLQVLSPSRFPRYDQEAVDAMRRAAPFPHPPASMVQDDGKIYMTWSFVLYMKNWGISDVQ